MDADGSIIAQAKSFEEDLVFVDVAQSKGDIHEAVADETEAVYDALVLGTRDYVRKCGFSKVLIGLSGGIDSALTACIAVDALGAENGIGVAMPSENSSQDAMGDPKERAANLTSTMDVGPTPPPFH